MKKMLIVCAFAAGLGFAAAQAGDDESLAACQAFAADNDVSADPCACIADAIAEHPDLKDEQVALKTMDDWNAASPELHEAIDGCVAE